MKARILLTALAVLFTVSASLADEAEDRAQRLAAIREKLTARSYQLRHKYVEGETLRWDVAHIATTETTIQGNSQTSKSRSLSTKVWRIKKVEENSFTFEHLVDHVDMWQKISDRPEVTYNSRTDKQPPNGYEGVADSLGKPLAVYKIDSFGKILDRQSDRPTTPFGLGQVALLLPEDEIMIGQSWSAPNEIRAREEDGRIKVVKTRQLHVLEKVENGVATISIKTEVLTPLSNSGLKAQIVQQLTHGQIQFDIDKGRIVSKTMNWDETVIGFRGADSSMQYLAKFTEKLVEGSEAGPILNAAVPLPPGKETGDSELKR